VAKEAFVEIRNHPRKTASSVTISNNNLGYFHFQTNALFISYTEKPQF